MKKRIDAPEFVDPESLLAWQPVPGEQTGAWEMILYRDPDTGSYARLLKLEPGFRSHSTTPITHEFDEIVYNLSGEIIDDLTGRVYGPGTYAVFPEGQEHGPYSCPEGSLAIEYRHYRKKSKEAAE